MESQHLVAAIRAMFLALSPNERVETLKALRVDFCKTCGYKLDKYGCCSCPEY